jgi:hypothetical protein
MKAKIVSKSQINLPKKKHKESAAKSAKSLNSPNSNTMSKTILAIKIQSKTVK